ncbi:hypothetical protein MSIBF_A3330006 [groundwater metagenome]|uniref:Endonuclease GajA/Old nuclease/RecF-like AAA domain-containing protein n=1 Tax=groundwater metagenome TaxID=717931 RepID=A0A098EAW4_9ZZZZ
MQIKELKIDNFKGITSIEFRPKKINLIVGRNNTGKTSVLEAINLLFNPENIVQMYDKHLSDIIYTGAEYSEIAIEIDKSKKKLRISKPDKSEVIYQFKKDIIEAFIRALNKFFTLINLPENTIDTEEIRHELENKTDESIIPDIINIISKKSVGLLKDSEDKTVKYHLPFSEYSRISSILRPIWLDIFKQIPKQVRKSVNEKVLEQNYVLSVINANMFEMFFSPFEHLVKISEEKDAVLIKNLIDVKFESEEKDAEIKRKIRNIESIIKEYNLIENLERLDFDYVTFKDNEKLTFIPFEFLGDGFKAITGLLWYLSSQNIKNKIVLLDEPEIHMHPGYILELIKILIKFSDKLNIQFFITTHSSDLIDLFVSEDLLPEEQKYLKEELLVIRVEKIDDLSLPEYLNYNDAKSTKDELLFDLRGI